VLLDAADSGMPQRFLWLPTDDLDIPDVKPHEPKPINCCAIAEKLTYTAGCEISLPPGAVYLLDRTRVLGMRGQGVNAALDGHLGLCRAKVAIGLALLHSDCALTVADDSGTCPGW
jgi:hypothetical protein